MLQLLKQSSEVDQLTMLQNQVESVKGIMASSLDKILARAERLEMQADELNKFFRTLLGSRDTKTIFITPNNI